ncbi:MAG: hypothetical protein J6W04_05630 [Bacteroidales bacterium]|nr:hypothetical protein [Bacteroidales bacterium]
MSYKYFAIIRPLTIGTIPNDKRPVRIENYPEGMKQVETSDGRTLWAWGEVIYQKPLTEYEQYSYDLRSDFEYAPVKHIGYWMKNPSCEIIRLDDRYFLLDGWNGIDYGHCFECLTKTKMIESTEYTLKPIYRFETENGRAVMEEMYSLEEGSDEWEEKTNWLNEIVSYTVTENR